MAPHCLGAWVGLTRRAAAAFDQCRPREVLFVGDAKESAMRLWLPDGYHAISLIGELFKHSASPLSASERYRAKYRKRGWSEAKVERAIAQMESLRYPPFVGLAGGMRDTLARVVRDTDPVFLHLGPWPTGAVPQQCELTVHTMLHDSSAVRVGPLYRVVQAETV